MPSYFCFYNIFGIFAFALSRMMMLYRVILFVLLLCSSVRVHSQGCDRGEWILGLDDNRLVSSLSIPGSHDSATGEGMYGVPGFGVTQTIGLAEQWRCGVRAFDLRPAVRDTELHIYHGILRTKVSFSEALDILCQQLKSNPKEFAIVLLREETESENDAERALWPSLVGDAIEKLGDVAAYFDSDMTIGDARGKIIFISRNDYVGTNKGALVSGWSHSKEGTCSASITSYKDGKKARLLMQDYYAPTNERKRAEKFSAVKKYLSLSDEAPIGVWTMNFLSGYSSTCFGCVSIATTSGYKRNAEWIHKLVEDHLMDLYTNKTNRKLGIVFMDFVGVDEVSGDIFHWGKYKTNGDRLVHLLIDSN